MPDIRIGEFALDPSLHTVSGPEGTVRLEPKVMLVLLCLAEHPNQVITKERLMRAAWADTFVTDDVLTRAISELRRAFGDSVKEPRFIQTIPKGGYRLIAPVFTPVRIIRVAFHWRKRSERRCRPGMPTPRRIVHSPVLDRGCSGWCQWSGWFCWRLSSASG